MNESLVEMLVDLGAIQYDFNSGFTYASGKKGPIYCDTRKIIGNPDVRSVFVDALVEKVKGFEQFDAIGAMATGAISLGALLADRLRLPLFYVRPSAKDHGQSNKIEGLSLKNSTVKKVILFEDLINSGGSVIKGAQAAKEAGLDVTKIVSLVDYSFKKTDEALRSVCTRDSLITFEDILSSIPEAENDQKIKLLSWHKEFYN